uniref:Adrenonovelin n=1 Tax=Mesocricetus auratus TaxID=10036 RepID=Q6QAE5_MESAU|nr:adrenonovelin [Mesocricetus auratus]
MGIFLSSETVIKKAATPAPYVPCACLTFKHLLTPDALFLLLLAQKKNLWHRVCANHLNCEILKL